MKEKKRTVKKKTETAQKENFGGAGFLWSVAENFLRELFSQAEKKLQQGVEEFSFLVKKKLAAFVLIFVGAALFLAGTALALERALAFWGFPGWGMILTGAFCFILAFLVGKIKR